MYKDAKAKWHSIAIFVVMGGVWGGGRKCRECVGKEGEDLTTTTKTMKKKAESPGTYKKNGQAAPAYTHARASKLEYYTYMLPGLLSIN